MSAGSIVVDLLLKTGSFSTDTARSAKDLEKLKKEALATGRAFGEAFKSLAATVGITASAAGLAVLTQSAIDAADELDDLSQKTGVTVESLSALAYVANVEGVAVADLSSSLAKLARSMSDAARGSKEQAGAFDALGVAVQNSDGSLRATDAVLRDIAQRFAGYEDSAEKAALAQAIFGKSGADLIPLLNYGAEGLDRMTREAEKLGLVITTETAAAAADFNDTLTKIRTVSQQVGNVLAQQLLPPMKAIADEFLRSRQEGGGFADMLAGGLRNTLQAIAVLASDFVFVIQGIGRELAALAAQAVELPQAILKRDFSGFRAISDAVKEDGVRARAELDAFQRRVLGLQETISGSFRPSQNYGEGSRSTRTTAPRLTSAGPEAKRTPRPDTFDDEVTRSLTSLIGQTDTVKLAEITAQFQKLEQLAAAGLDPKIVEDLRQLLTPADTGNVGPPMSAELEKINALLAQTDSARLADAQRTIALLNDELSRTDAGSARFVQLQEAILGAQDQLTELAGTFPELKKQADDIGKDLGLTFSSAFEDAVVEGKKLGDVLRGLGDDLLRLFVRKSLTEPLVRAVTGFNWAGLFSGILGSAKGNVFDGAGRVTAFASGGIVTGPTPFTYGGGKLGVMGEAGTEGIFPLKRGPDGKLGVAAYGMGGGGGVTIHQTINVAAGASRNELMQGMAAAKSAAVAEIQDLMRRGSLSMRGS